MDRDRFIDKTIKRIIADRRNIEGGYGGDGIRKILEEMLDEFAALTAQGQEVDLHAKIMNMPVDEMLMETAKGESFDVCQSIADGHRHAYRMGCRDTRHAAAELVAGTWRKVELYREKGSKIR